MPPLARALLVCLTLALPAHAQNALPDRLDSNCFALASAIDRVIPASYGAPIADNTVRLRYLNHASYALETQRGLLAVTDFTGFISASDIVPDVVTMNNAHGTHWTDRIDPRIAHVLPGWGSADAPARYDLELGEMLVRNVTTDVRSGGGVRANANSIFIFEVAGLCIGHLGHLHQIPSDEQYAQIGRLDVVMVPVDGGYTMDVASMAGVVRRLRASVVLPMHWFSGQSLEDFVQDMSAEFEIVELDQPDIEMSRDRLPRRPTIIVLRPELLP